MSRLASLWLPAVAGWLTLFAAVPPAARSSRMGPLDLRFHHLHLRVADPAASMSALAAEADGSTVILQGLGVGVQLSDRYVLFDRGAGAPAVRGDVIARHYGVAVRWLRESGAHVAPEELDAAIANAQALAGALEHVAFATPNLEAALDALGARGRAPIRRTGDAAVFSTDSGELVEIVRESNRPDAFWCPMHVDVRSAGAGKCARCGMDLVPIPPLRQGEYRLEIGLVTTFTSHPPPGSAARFGGLQVRVADPDGRPVTRFVTVHEHPLHLFIISRNLQYFRHVHPDELGAAAPGFDGLFHVDVSELPGLPPGPYMAIADVLPYGGTPQMLHRAFVTPGHDGPVFVEVPSIEPGPAEVVVDGMRVRIDAALPPRKPGSISMTISDGATGVPVTDLEPFLGAPAHMLIVNPDLTQSIHAHPEDQPAGRPQGIGRPTVTFKPLMPASGLYKLWVQFQRRGRVSTASFVVRVP